MGKKEVKQSQRGNQIAIPALGCSCSLVLLSFFSFIFAVSYAALDSFNKWLDAEPYSSFSVRETLDQIALKQLNEYAKNGSFSSELSVNAECYDDGMTEVFSSNSVMNVLKSTSCWDLSGLPSTAERFFIIDSSLKTLKKAARVSCGGIYFEDNLSVGDDEKMPQLPAKGEPYCPPEYDGDIVQPDYDEYLIWDGEVLDPTNYFKQIAEKQIQEFLEKRKISAQLGFETDCYKGWTEISQESEIATNFVVSKQCFGLSLQSYVNQVIPGRYVDYDYDTNNERWKSPYVNLTEITCAGNYSLDQIKALQITDLSQQSPDRPEYDDPLYPMRWCPSSVDGDLIYPDGRSHRFDLENEPVPSDLPVPPRKPDSGSPNV